MIQEYTSIFSIVVKTFGWFATCINPLMPNDLLRCCAMNPLKIKIPSKKSWQAALHREI
jgi:hypothetical protein